MDKILFIANWKSYKNSREAVEFLKELEKKLQTLSRIGEREIVIAPPYTLLSECKKYIEENNLPVSLASQNVSAFPQGAYTGEINASQLNEFVEFVIVGHSERRKYLHETETDIENKVREAAHFGLRIIQCVQDENSPIYKGVEIVAYEPPSAIGSGNPDEPEHVSKVFQELRKATSGRLIYGGSILPQNKDEYLKIQDLSGFLIGGASLNVDSFISILS